MVYIVLNLILCAALIYFTHLMDHRVRTEAYEVSSLSISILLGCTESLMLLLVLLFSKIWAGNLLTQVMRFMFFVDAMMFISLTYGFMAFAVDTRKTPFRVVRILLCLGALVFVFTCFKQIELSIDDGITVRTNYIFNLPARKYFPWDWFFVYNAVIKFLIPVIGLLIMTIKNEFKSTQLEKSQSIGLALSLAVMWGVLFVVNAISKVIPQFNLLYTYAYLFMYVVLYTSLTHMTIPTGRGVFVTFVKVIISYLVPAGILGCVFMFLQPIDNNFSAIYILLVSVIVVLCVAYSYWISYVFSKSKNFYTSDYEASLERDLASIDYTTGEMDYIASHMFDIVKRNIETSAMNVYILNNQSELLTAYSSNARSEKIAVNYPVFDVLLNLNRTVVLQSQIENEHDLAEIRDTLQNFFDTYKCDALFILNEGHNIFGLITLARKTNGDHFKDYDYKVFEKLYSHFFVYGYYMRNIANKEIIGVVNREIRMSSQIITSIQENIDHVKNEKVDTGYLMVPAHNIGGEFIDMIRLTATRHLFVVGDLSGKGIAASMNMVILKSIIRTFLAETHDFKELVIKTNSFIRESLQKGTIFAGLFALVDFETDTMYYINCGIPALMMYTQVYNNVIEIQGSGHILGFVKDIAPYISVKTTKLNRGDIILACTDGLVQSHSLRGEMYGKERIQQAILDNSTYNAQRMAQFTFDDLITFMSKEMEDDVSILVLKYDAKVEEEEFASVSESQASEEVPQEIEVSSYVEENSSAFIEEPADTIASDTEIDLPETLTNESDIKVDVENYDDELPPDVTFSNTAEESVFEDLPKSIPESDAEFPLPDDPFSDESVEVEEEKQPVIPEEAAADPDMPDLSDLDAMLKEAGL